MIITRIYRQNVQRRVAQPLHISSYRNQESDSERQRRTQRTKKDRLPSPEPRGHDQDLRRKADIRASKDTIFRTKRGLQTLVLNLYLIIWKGLIPVLSTTILAGPPPRQSKRGRTLTARPPYLKGLLFQRRRRCPN